MNIDQKRINILLLIILWAGLFLRMYRLGAESLWLDEGVTVYYARLSLAEIFSRIASEEFNPPLYYSLIHFWIQIFGDSEFSVRMPSVIFGVLSILLIYKTGRLMAGPEVGLLSALIVALNRFHIHFSQEARVYALLVFASTLSFYFWLRLANDFDRRNVLGYLTASFFLMHTHVYALFIILTQNLYCILRYFQSAEIHKLTLKRWILLQVSLLILFVPWLTVLAKQFLRVQEGFWMDKPPFCWIPGTFLRYAGGYNVLTGMFAVLLFLLAAKAILKFENGKLGWRRNHANWNGLLLLWLFVTILIPFVVSQFSSPIFQIKYTIAASIAYYILIAKGITLGPSKYLKSFLMGIVILVSLANMYLYYASVKKERWRETVEYVESVARKNDLLVFVAGYCLEGGYEYYAKRKDLQKRAFPSNVRNVDEVNIAELEPLLQTQERVWLILSHHNLHDPKNLTLQKLQETYDLVKQKIFRRNQKYLFPKLNAKITPYFDTKNYFTIEAYLFEKRQ